MRGPLLKVLKILPFETGNFQRNPTGEQLQKGALLEFNTDLGPIKARLTSDAVQTEVMNEYMFKGELVFNERSPYLFDAIYDPWFQTGIMNTYQK